MHRKLNSLSCFKKNLKNAEARTRATVRKINVLARSSYSGSRLKALRTKYDGAYISTDFKDYLTENGIEHQRTVAYIHQQNRVAERMNRTLVDLFRPMLHNGRFDKRFWNEALSTAVYIRNPVTTRCLLANTPPFHLWIRKALDLSHLGLFCCKWWYVVPKSKFKKLHPRPKMAIMIGYSSHSSG